MCCMNFCFVSGKDTHYLQHHLWCVYKCMYYNFIILCLLIHFTLNSLQLAH